MKMKWLSFCEWCKMIIYLLKPIYAYTWRGWVRKKTPDDFDKTETRITCII